MRTLSFFSAIAMMMILSRCDGDMYCANKKNSHCCITLANTSPIRLHCIRGSYAGTQPEWKRTDSASTALASGQSKELPAGGAPHTCWESHLKNRVSFVYYFFNADSLEAAAGDSSVLTTHGLLEARRIDLAYLQQTGFKISYPE